MDKLKRPVAEDYSITDHSYRKMRILIPKIENVLIRILPIMVWTVIFIQSLNFGQWGILIGVVGGGVIAIGSSKLFVLIFRNLPIYKKVLAYGRALREYAQINNEHKNKQREYDAESRRQKSNYWKNLDDGAFKMELAELYKNLGFEVNMYSKEDKATIDFELKKDGQVTIVYCKRQTFKIGSEVINQMHTAMSEFGADKAIIATLSGITRSAEEQIKDKPIAVIDVNDIAELQKTIGKMD